MRSIVARGEMRPECEDDAYSGRVGHLFRSRSATCSGAPATPSSEPRRRHPSPVAALRVPGARRPGPERSCGSRSERTLDADEHSWMMARATGQRADRSGMSGRLRSESVADSVRNRWPGGVGIRKDDARELRGSFG